MAKAPREGGNDPAINAEIAKRLQLRGSRSPTGPQGFVIQSREQGNTAPRPPRVVRVRLPELSEALAERPETGLDDARSLLKRLLGLGHRSVPNTPFEPEEREIIPALLQELKQQLKETQDTQELAVKHLEELEKTLKEIREASEASERIGRKDWALLAIGALTTLV